VNHVNEQFPVSGSVGVELTRCRASLVADAGHVDVPACLSVIDRALAEAAHACGDALR
jgi:hypothetical protein